MNVIHQRFADMFLPLFGESFGESPALPIVSQYSAKLMMGQPDDLDILVKQLSKCTGDGTSLAILAHVYYLKSRHEDEEAKAKSLEYLKQVKELNAYDGYLTLSIINFIGSLTDNNIEHDIKAKMMQNMSPDMGSLFNSLYDSMVTSLKLLRDLYGFGLTREEKEAKAVKLLFRAHKLDQAKTTKIFNGICELKSVSIIEYLMNEQEKLREKADTKIKELEAENLELRYQPGGPGFTAAQEEFKQLSMQK